MDIMNTLLFVFSIIIITIPTITLGASYLTYQKTHNILFKYGAVLMGMYTIDLLFLHYIDFFHVSTVSLPETFISFATFKILIFAGMLMVTLHIILTIFNKPFDRSYLLFIVLFMIIEIALKLLPENDMIVWSFYTTRQLFTILLCTFFFYLYWRCKDQKIKEYAKKFIYMFCIFLLMNIIIGIEDALVSFQQEAFSTSGLIFKERNFTENIYWMVVTILIFIHALRYIKELQLPSNAVTLTTSTKAFIDDIHLTKREKEIFTLILQHYGNTEIADKLCISSGTLKAHIHNIYAKANVTHRNELIKKVSENTSLYHKNNVS